MPRSTKSPARRKRKKALLKHAKGFRWSRKNKYRLAKEHLFKAWKYQYRDRKKRKKEKRRLWNVQIGAATRQEGVSYSKFMHGVRQNKIELDRKVLAQLAQEHPDVFKKIMEEVK